MNIENILHKIRLKGGRITKIRQTILQFLIRKTCLASQKAIQEYLTHQNLQPNRSTLFRELQYLVQHNIVIKNTISGMDYYEIPKEHHHHLICTSCSSIQKICLNEHFEDYEKKIALEKNFFITSHSLEFYGYCTQCQT